MYSYVNVYVCFTFAASRPVAGDSCRLQGQVECREEHHQDDGTYQIVDELDFLCIHNICFFKFATKVKVACYKCVTRPLRVCYTASGEHKVKKCYTIVTFLLRGFNENVIPL